MPIRQPWWNFRAECLSVWEIPSTSTSEQTNLSKMEQTVCFVPVNKVISDIHFSQEADNRLAEVCCSVFIGTLLLSAKLCQFIWHMVWILCPDKIQFNGWKLMFLIHYLDLLFCGFILERRGFRCASSYHLWLTAEAAIEQVSFPWLSILQAARKKKVKGQELQHPVKRSRRQNKTRNICKRQGAFSLTWVGETTCDLIQHWALLMQLTVKSNNICLELSTVDRFLIRNPLNNSVLLTQWNTPTIFH